MTRTIIQGNADGNGSLTIGHITCGIEFSLPMRPKWSGTTGVVFQVLLTVLTTVYIFFFFYCYCFASSTFNNNGSVLYIFFLQ